MPTGLRQGVLIESLQLLRILCVGTQTPSNPKTIGSEQSSTATAFLWVFGGFEGQKHGSCHMSQFHHPRSLDVNCSTFLLMPQKKTGSWEKLRRNHLIDQSWVRVYFLVGLSPIGGLTWETNESCSPMDDEHMCFVDPIILEIGFKTI